LNPSNFDYDNVTVIPQAKTDSAGGPAAKKTGDGSSSGDVISADQFKSDMKIYEQEIVTQGEPTPTGDLEATIVPQSPWYKHWELNISEDVYTYGGVKIRDRENISFAITRIADLGGGPDVGVDKVIWNSITLRPNIEGTEDIVSCYKYEIKNGNGIAYFDCGEVFQEFFPGGAPGNVGFGFDLSGYVVMPVTNEVKMFSNISGVEIILGDVFVSGDIGHDTPTTLGTENDPFETIQYAINRAAPGDTIYIFEKTTGYPYLWGNPAINLNKPVTLVGEYIYKAAPPTVSLDGSSKSGFMLKIDSDGSGARLIMLTFENGGAAYNWNCDGLQLVGCNNVVISNCCFRFNNGDGICITNSNNNIITKCSSYSNRYAEGDQSEGLEF
jgi:hypothetical protein